MILFFQPSVFSFRGGACTFSEKFHLSTLKRKLKHCTWLKKYGLLATNDNLCHVHCIYTDMVMVPSETRCPDVPHPHIHTVKITVMGQAGISYHNITSICLSEDKG